MEPTPSPANSTRSLFGQAISLRSLYLRAFFAASLSLVSIFLLVSLPYYAYAQVAASSTLSIPELNFVEIGFFGALIGIFGAIQILFRKTWLGDLALIGNGIAQVFYIYLATYGGSLSFLGPYGISFSVNFQMIVYFLLLPSAVMTAWGVVSLLTNATFPAAPLSRKHYRSKRAQLA